MAGSLQGQLLIASSNLSDPNFARTVVLVAAHSESGALGLILNRELETPLRKVWEMVSTIPCLREDNVRHGGPVGGSLMAVHDQPPLANLVVTEELYVATELNPMELLVTSTEGRARFYVGHAGWGPGQLESEMEEGSWLLLPASSGHVFDDQDALTLWRTTMTEVGRRQVRALFSLKHIPENPRVN
jgi:putative transcriptional regulator